MNFLPFQTKINSTRLGKRLEDLAELGAIEGGGSCRLALSDEDKQGRDLVVSWMKQLGMAVHIDRVGNIIAIRQGRKNLPPIMSGSHIDTVKTGGRFDGSYGVLAALEVILSLNDGNIETERPVAVVVFTNEEGVRYTPDMMGSLVYSGGLPVDEALSCKGVDGSILGDELARIQYAGDTACGELVPHAFLELHIEQGPVLEKENITIGAVENLLCISWREITIVGESNHAGTTPHELRHDAGWVAAKIVGFVRDIALSMGKNQRATCGAIEFFPNQINVIPAKATLTVDLRNSDQQLLLNAERDLAVYMDGLCIDEGVKISSRQLARFEPVQFDSTIVQCIESVAEELQYSVRRMTSGAGHDAQMMSRICPSSMIFVPSEKGISHNPAEYTSPVDLESGANVLLGAILKLAG